MSPRARWFWATRALLAWLVVGGIQVVILLNTHRPDAIPIGIIVATGVLAVAHIAVMPAWRYRVHRWEQTPTAVYTQTGWFTQERRIAPIARIQTVDTHRGPIEQIFRLTNVTVTTASAAGPLHIKGLERLDAERLVAELTDRTQASADDGT